MSGYTVYIWRILYVILEEEHAVDILAIRKRPPYDYGDLGQPIAAPQS